MKFLTRNSKRLSNFELLRIFSMFLIVLHHCTVHGVFNYWSNNDSILNHVNNLICFLLSSGGKLGVALFVMLTGYFSCQSKFKLKKWLDVYLQTLFFSILIVLIWFLINRFDAVKAISPSIFPLTKNTYWFVTSWLLLLTFTPILNIILGNTSPQVIKNYLIYGALIWSVFPTFKLEFQYSTLLYFMYLYLLGGSLRLGYVIISKRYFLFVSIFFLIFLAYLFKVFFGTSATISLWKNLRYVEMNSVYVLVLSLWIFYVFGKLKINFSFINWISSSMFGVYLLHDNNLIRPYLWHTLLNMDIAMNSPYFGIWAILISICVFCLCIVLDKILSLIYLPLIGFIEKKVAKLKILENYF